MGAESPQPFAESPHLLLFRWFLCFTNQNIAVIRRQQRSLHHTLEQKEYNNPHLHRSLGTVKPGINQEFNNVCADIVAISTGKASDDLSGMIDLLARRSERSNLVTHTPLSTTLDNISLTECIGSSGLLTLHDASANSALLSGESPPLERVANVSAYAPCRITRFVTNQDNETQVCKPHVPQASLQEVPW
ncbi:MAG: hypothetical protein KTR25_10735 [Myxococcales bacterium]|nr:hypothetical protein [Myxococcales bacterium]